MKTLFLNLALLLFISCAILLSCKKDNSTLSYGGNRPGSGNNSPPPISYPPASGPARIFNFLSQSSQPVNGLTTRSRYVLYDNGAFEFQYIDMISKYPGSYKQENNAIMFQWEGWSVAGPLGATGTLRGDTLTVVYNDIMVMTDFEDAVYLKTP